MTDTHKDFKDVLDQHRRMRDLVEELRGFLHKPRPEVGDSGSHSWASELAEKLIHLHAKVSRHFRDEERSGFLEEMSAENPSAGPSIVSLHRQHDRILADFRSVLGAAMVYAEGRTPHSRQLRRWTRSILDELSEHEREETELLQRLHYREVGEGD